MKKINKPTKSVPSDEKYMYVIKTKIDGKAFKIISDVFKRNCRTEDISDRKSQELLALMILSELTSNKLLN